MKRPAAGWNPFVFDEKHAHAQRRLLRATLFLIPASCIISLFHFILRALPAFLALAVLLELVVQLAPSNPRWLRYPDRLVTRTRVVHVFALAAECVVALGMSTYFYWLATVGQAPTYILVGIFLLLAAGIQAYRMRGLFKNGARFEITLTPQYIRLQAIDGQALRLDWNTHPKLGPFDAQRLCIYNDATGTSFLQRNLLPTRATDLHNIIDYYSHHPENRWELAAPEGLNRVVDMCTHTKK